MKLYEYAKIIKNDWVNVSPYAQPYLDAMGELTSITDIFYHDSAKSVVAYFLSNASGWRGVVARRVKKELNALLKTC